MFFKNLAKMVAYLGVYWGREERLGNGYFEKIRRAELRHKFSAFCFDYILMCTL